MPPAHNRDRRHDETGRSGSEGGGLAAEIAEGCGLKGTLGRVRATAWVEAGRSVSLAGEPTSRRTLAGSFSEHGKSASSERGTGDGDSALCARADRGGATHDFIATAVLAPAVEQRPTSRTAVEREQLPRVLKPLEQPA
jgi:hypothetical protein